MILGDIADGLARGAESATRRVSGAFFEPVLRLGVTGLSGAGKTVFITSLVANLLERGRMPALTAAAEGRIRAVHLQPQPDDTLPRFAYEDHLAKLTGSAPEWPEGTRSISELRLSFRVSPSGLLGGVTGPRTVHLDIVDYPGEWLLDLGLLDRSFAEWSRETLTRLERRAEAGGFLEALCGVDASDAHGEPVAAGLAAAFTEYLGAAREAGYADLTPGRFLLPGEMAGSPALTFAPLPEGPAPRGSLRAEFARRFEAYKARVVKPFFRDHFARIDRQVVLVDILGAIDAGPRAVDDLGRAMTDILAAFRPGTNAWLTRLLLGRRVERILFAATKADHVHQSQHGRLAGIAEALLADARRRADFAGAVTGSMAIAALRATTEDRVTHDGRTIDVVRGRPEGGGAKPVAIHPGDLPEDPARLLTPAREGAEEWPGAGFDAPRFAPQPLTLKPGEGPPHIRLDRAVEWLIGDRL